MRTTAKVGDGKTATTEGVMNKAPTGQMTLDFREVDTIESIALGFRMEMFTLTDPNTDEEIAHVSTGTGLGTDAIEMSFGNKRALVRGRDLLKAWVATFDTEAAERMP